MLNIEVCMACSLPEYTNIKHDVYVIKWFIISVPMLKFWNGIRENVFNHETDVKLQKLTSLTRLFAMGLSQLHVSQHFFIDTPFGA